LIVGKRLPADRPSIPYLLNLAAKPELLYNQPFVNDTPFAETQKTKIPAGYSSFRALPGLIK